MFGNMHLMNHARQIEKIKDFCPEANILIKGLCSCIFYFTVGLQCLIYQVYNVLVMYPLQTLYFNGPSVYNIGFWQGLPDEDICATITKTSADIWRQVPKKCTEILWQHFGGFHVAVLSLLYAVFVYRFLNYLYFRLLILPYLLKTWKQLSKTPLKTKEISN